VPAESARQLPAAIAEARELLVPIAVDELMVLLAKTAKVWPLPADWDDTADFYVEALEDLPADLVHAALKHCRLTLKWFPKPAEMREPIARELERRNTVLRRLLAMKQRVELGDVEAPALRVVPTAEQKAEGEAIAAETRKVLDSVSLKRIPGREEDRKQERPLSLAQMYKATGLKNGAWLKDEEVPS